MWLSSIYGLLSNFSCFLYLVFFDIIWTMSLSNGQVLGAATGVGGVAMLPLTGSGPLFEAFQLTLKLSLSLVAVMLLIQVSLQFLSKNKLKIQHVFANNKRFWSPRVSVQIALLYVLIIGFASFPWLKANATYRQITQAKEIQTQQPPSQDSASSKVVYTGTPSHLVIPKVGVDIDIKNGEYKKNTWTLSSNAVLFATSTALPNNDTQTTVLYGHNTTNVLGPTKNLQLGDQLFVQTKEGHVFEYRYVSDRVVKPNDTSVFENSQDPKLVLITCEGLFNSHRRLMTFDFVTTVHPVASK